MSKNIVIFDCNYICHTVKQVVKKKMLAHKGVRTDILYGFLRRVLPICEKLKADIPVFVWDSYSSIRKEVYPSYKAGRKNRDDLTEDEKAVNDSAYKQFDMLREFIIPRLGFQNNFYQDGYEGDDLIASVALTARMESKNNVCIVTRDNDMLQLLRDNVTIYDPTNKRFITEHSFKKKWGIEPRSWAMVKAIAGCSTDEVKGIYGVGEKRAAQYLRGLLKSTSKAFKDIKEQWQTVENNLLIVKLPMYGTVIPEVNFKKYFMEKEFHAVCTAYGMRSLLDDTVINRWKKAFGR